MELQVLISKYSTIFISNFAPFCLHVIKMYHFKNYLYCARKSIFNWLNFSCNKCIVYVGKQKKMWVQDKKMRFLDFNNCIKFLQKISWFVGPLINSRLFFLIKCSVLLEIDVNHSLEKNTLFMFNKKYLIMLLFTFELNSFKCTTHNLKWIHIMTHIQ